MWPQQRAREGKSCHWNCFNYYSYIFCRVLMLCQPETKKHVHCQVCKPSLNTCYIFDSLTCHLKGSKGAQTYKVNPRSHICLSCPVSLLLSSSTVLFRSIWDDLKSFLSVVRDHYSVCARYNSLSRCRNCKSVYISTYTVCTVCMYAQV